LSTWRECEMASCRPHGDKCSDGCDPWKCRTVLLSISPRLPTSFSARLSFPSRRCTSASTDILHSKTDPDVTSMKLSIPKPTSEMLPAIAPATTATKPSKAFHTMAKYSSLRPWRTTAVRSNMAVSAMSRVCNAPSQSRTKTCRTGSCHFGWPWRTLSSRFTLYPSDRRAEGGSLWATMTRARSTTSAAVPTQY